MSTLDPDDVANAARHIAAKMVADQAVPLMLTLVNCSGDPDNITAEDILRFRDDDRAAVVLVARGRGKRKLLDWLAAVTGPPIVEVEHVHDEPILPRFNIAPTRRPSAVRTFEQGPQCGACGSDNTCSEEQRGGNFRIVCQDCKAEWLVRPSVEDHPENCNCELCR